MMILTTAPFKKSTAIAAPISVKLYFKTSAKDTDFYASVLDIAPDGAIHVVGNSGKIRGSYLQGMDKIVPLTPGKIYEATVTPWDFAHEFAPGHKLGLFIQSTGFPVYARNLGAAEPIADATKMMVQHNTFLMGKGHPSSLSYYVLWQK
jgi:predicted acyl esterase